MRFSVVIPTYNRSAKLKQCIEALFAQEFDPREFEIIVVDDGSQDSTQFTLKRLQKNAPVALQLLSQSNQGQGVARNKGIECANGEIVLFIGDDIAATPGLLKEHDRYHRMHPEKNEAVLGFVTWHPKLTVTPLMKFMETGGAVAGRFGGHQFAYDLLKGKTKADYRFFYTANISLKRELIKEHKFDPWFSGYGWEDIELGFRLTKKAGLALYYNCEAVAYHDHAADAESFASRMRDIGRSSHLLHAKYPELNAVPDAKKQRILAFLSAKPILGALRLINKNLYFYALSKKYFLEGLKKGIMIND